MGTMPRSTGPRAIDLEHQRSFRAALPYNHEIAYQPARSTQYTVRSRVYVAVNLAHVCTVALDHRSGVVKG